MSKESTDDVRVAALNALGKLLEGLIKIKVDLLGTQVGWKRFDEILGQTNAEIESVRKQIDALVKG